MTMKPFALVLCCAVALGGCVRPKTDGVELSVAREFRAMPVAEQARAFRQYPVDQQLGLYFFTHQHMHHPPIILAHCFALNGAAGVELLRAKLSEEINAVTVRDIAKLLRTMDSMKTYDVAGDTQLMEALRAQIAKFPPEGWAGLAADYANKIGHERSGIGLATQRECT
ncbi:MAG: hypothetical protein HUJ27_10390 [Rhodobacteraceae bacterium]|nr:hypothetical protein [Paracoccaceae bacterium]